MNRVKRKDRDSNGFFSLAFLTIMVFFIVFSIHLKGFSETITPRILGMIVVVIASFWKNGFMRKLSIVDFKFIIANLFVLLYTFFITLTKGVFDYNNLAVSSIINYFVMVCVLPLLFEKIIENTELFVKALTIATVIQSIIVIMSFLIPSVRTYLESIQTFTFERYSWRIVGLGIAGAGGSVYLLCGYIVNLWLFRFRKVSSLYMVTLLAIMIGMILVGRTGFYAATILTAYYLLTSYKLDAQAFKRIAIIVVAVGLVVFVLSHISFNESLFSYTISRLGDIFKENNALTAIASVDNPDLSWEMLWGIGVVRGYTASGRRVFNDSGYIQKVMSIGYVFTIVYYLSAILYIVRLIKRIGKRKERTFFYLLLICMLVVEYKEPFMFALALPFTIIMLLRLRSKEYKEGNQKHESERDNKASAFNKEYICNLL